MKKSFLLLFTVLLCTSSLAFGWGRVGHDAIAYIAECNLTPKAKRNIEKYLGHSIVYDASWMDYYRHTPAYGHTSSWHVASVDEQNRYVPREDGEDAISGLEDAMAKLHDYKHRDDSTVNVCIKLIVHLVGDMHCPVHVKYPGVKSFDIWLDGKKHRYHTYWDGYSIDGTRTWSYIGWQQLIDHASKREKRAITAGTPRDWFEQSARDCRIIYEWAQPEQQFEKNEGRDLVNNTRIFAEGQVLKAGYRLAAVLNELFG